MSLKVCLSLTIALVTAVSFAAFDPKQFPSRDKVLAEFETSFKQGSVLNFFDKRDADPSLAQCRTWLKTATEAYEKATAEGNIAAMDAVMAGDGEESEPQRRGYARKVLSAAVDEAASLLGSKRLSFADGSVIAGDMTERPTVSENSGLVDLLQACGRCLAVVRIEKKTIYESEGWCKLPGKPKDVVAKGTKLLTEWKNYPRNKVDGRIDGFNSIAAFGLETEFTPKAVQIKQGDRAVIVVRTLGDGGFGYFGDIFYKPQEANGVKSFSLQFALPEEKKDSDLPEIYQSFFDPVLENPKVKYVIDPLNQDVVGKWYVDDEGVLRYYTRADFGVPPYDFMRRIAFAVMMDAIFHMHQKVK